jgi:hypothetical protein
MLLLLLILFLLLLAFITLVSICLHSSLLWTIVFHSRTPIFFEVYLVRKRWLDTVENTVSNHLFLGRPRGLFPVGLHFSTILTVSSSFLRITWPSHCIRCPLMKLMTGISSNSSCNSQLNFLLHASVLLS